MKLTEYLKYKKFEKERIAFGDGCHGNIPDGLVTVTATTSFGGFCSKWYELRKGELVEIKTTESFTVSDAEIIH